MQLRKDNKIFSFLHRSHRFPHRTEEPIVHGQLGVSTIPTIPGFPTIPLFSEFRLQNGNGRLIFLCSPAYAYSPNLPSRSNRCSNKKLPGTRPGKTFFTKDLCFRFRHRVPSKLCFRLLSHRSDLHRRLWRGSQQV